MSFFKKIAVKIETVDILFERVRKDPEDYISFFRLAEILERRGNLLPAIDYYITAEELVSKALERNPDDPMVNYHYARIWGRSWKRDLYGRKIKKALEKALEGFVNMFYQNPEDINYHRLIEDVCVRLESYKKSVEIYLFLLEKDPSSIYALDRLAYAYYIDGQAREAVKVLDRLIEIAPDYAEAHRFLGIIYFYCIKDYKNAKRNIERYLKLVPGDIDIREFLGRINEKIKI